MERQTRPGSENSVRKVRERLLDALEAQPEPRTPDGPPEKDKSAPMALAAVRAGDARKAKEITALHVAHLTSATSFFVNMVGNSKAQINAIVKSIEDEVYDNFGRRANRQGKALSGWVCLDYDDVVVNVFAQSERDFYQMDKFWHAAQSMDLADVLVPNTAADADAADAASESDQWVFGDDDDWELDDGAPAAAS